MNFWEKLKFLIDKRYTSIFLKHYKNDYFCNKWWCHKVEIVTIPLSEIKSRIKSMPLDEPVHRLIEHEILMSGFDYSKSHIYVNSKKYIVDGHHRYFILKKHFDDSYMITDFVITDIDNVFFYIFKMSWIHLCVKIYRFLFKRRLGQTIELEL